MQLKTLGKRPIRSHRCHILESLSVLSFDNYIAFTNANLIHKCLHGQTPEALCDTVQPLQAAGSSTLSVTAGNCKVPSTWNYLPTIYMHTVQSVYCTCRPCMHSQSAWSGTDGTWFLFLSPVIANPYCLVWRGGVDNHVCYSPSATVRTPSIKIY